MMEEKYGEGEGEEDVERTQTNVWEDDEGLRALGASYHHHVELLRDGDDTHYSSEEEGVTDSRDTETSDEVLEPYAVAPPPVNVEQRRTRVPFMDEEEAGGGSASKKIIKNVAVVGVVFVAAVVVVVFLGSAQNTNDGFAKQIKGILSNSVGLSGQPVNYHSEEAKSEADTVLDTVGYQNIADISNPTQSGEINVFYDGVGTRGRAVVNILSRCYGLKTAYHQPDKSDSNWLDSQVSADVVSTNALSQTKFSKTDRIFMMMRNPLVRVKEAYYQKINPFDHHYDPEVRGMTYEEYVLSDHLESSPVCRDICQQPDGELTKECWADAKEFLRTKVVVGVYEWYGQSLKRYKEYFHWPHYSVSAQSCEEQQFEAVANKFKDMSDLDKDSPNYQKASEKIWHANFCDMILYSYIKKELFREQSKE